MVYYLLSESEFMKIADVEAEAYLKSQEEA